MDISLSQQKETIFVEDSQKVQSVEDSIVEITHKKSEMYDMTAKNLNPWENHGADIRAVVEDIQKESQDEWPAWQQVRQSKQLRESGTSQLRMDGIVKETTTEDLHSEGITSTDQNSFAVLSDIQIVSLASQMGINSESLNFEKIDALKDLENARMKLIEQNSSLLEQENIIVDENFPLEDQVVLEWGSEESDKESCVIPVSSRKSKSAKKKKRKTRAVKAHPVDDPTESGGDKSMASPRFNLRDRKTIKKVYK